MSTSPRSLEVSLTSLMAHEILPDEKVTVICRLPENFLPPAARYARPIASSYSLVALSVYAPCLPNLGLPLTLGLSGISNSKIRTVCRRS